MKRMDLIASANHLGMMARMAMKGGNYADALCWLSTGIDMLSSFPGGYNVAVPFLLHRAECLWQLGSVPESLTNLNEATRIGLPADFPFAENEACKWSNRGFYLYREGDFSSAEQCCSYALRIPASRGTRAEIFFYRIIARGGGRSAEVLRDAEEIRKLDANTVRRFAQRGKEIAIESFQKHESQRALKEFDLALALHPEDASKVKFKRSIVSYQTRVHFKMKQYNEALELGQESYRCNTSYKSKDEAARWKERGNRLWKENSLNLAIAYYSLAINFAPLKEKDLRATILSNRSLVYNKQGRDEEALSDARECVKSKPGWSKGSYRLGASLFALKKYNEAMQEFSTSLQLSLQESESSEHDQVDTLMQIISAAMELPDGTSDIQYAIPMTVIQRVVNKVVSEKDWKKLHLLFLGGGGKRNFKMGEGGLSMGCDASAVPLKEVIESNFPDREKFISVLRDHKAELPKERILLEEGLAATGSGEDDRAINLLRSSLHSDEISVKEKRDVLKRLCSLYFKGGHFQECLEAGRKLKAAFPDKTSKITAAQWKNWGNELNQERKFGLMADYYSLAIDFTPHSEDELLTALLSNRSLAHVNLKNYNKALEDARECMRIRPQWFRGYSRLGNCLIQMGRTEEALSAFCDAYQRACRDGEKQATAKEVISTAMSMDDGESRISCAFVPDVLKYLVKNAIENCDWTKLRFLYLGTSGKGGPANECDASQVPLESLIESDVADLHRLVTVMLERGASPSGLPGCARPPLLTAMERSQFPLALTLLKSGADPVTVVGEDAFTTKEGQQREWLQIGLKALERSDNKKALMFLSMAFHMCETSTIDLATLHRTLHALSEAHFRQNEHEKCIEAGNKCFKLKSLKSEEEARTWEGRANLAFDSEMYSTSIEYIKMALTYLPGDKTTTFSLLLCKRCDAHEKLDDLSRALEDANSASRMHPHLLEGYLGQLKCLRRLGRHREAMQAINECLRRTNDHILVYRLLSDALEIAGYLDEETSALTVTIPKETVTKLINDVVGMKDWPKLRSLYLGGGGSNSHAVGEGGLATGCDASMVSLGQVLQSTVPDKLLLVSALLRHGALANPITELDTVPLEEALCQDNLPVVKKLIDNGANPCVSTVDKGGAIIHKALRWGLKNGDFRFLKAMMSSKHPEIENVQDSDGNTLYHLASVGRKPNQNKCEAIRLLGAANVNPNLPNKKGLLAVDMVNKSDRRWKMLERAAAVYKPNTSSSPQSSLTLGHEGSSGGDEQDGSSAPTEEDISVTPEVIYAETEDEVSSTQLTRVKAKNIDYKQQRREDTRESISSLIEKVSVELTMFSVTPKDEEDIQTFSEAQASVEPVETFDEQPTEEIPSAFDEESEKPDNADSESDDTANTGEVDLDSPFEKLPWEVDCTDQVWKIMRGKRIGKVLRERIVGKIRMLANGRWSRNLCKRLDGVAKNAGIHLYESKLTKSHRIIWEKTIAFSGRCSGDPVLRFNSKNSQGRIYSDIIRVWDIVLDHDTLPRAIDRIVKSHKRGMDCIIKTNLKGIQKESSNNGSYLGACFPNRYAEISDLSLSNIEDAGGRDLPKEPQAIEKMSKVFFPPASADDQEYHILKFYSFSTALVNTILEGDLTSKIDFPFKITELEHAIVNLRPKPPSPIILLGRSGTGKTTCCLYRLWDKFQKYWEYATTAGPYLPRYKPPQEKTDEGKDEGSPVPETVNDVVRKGRVKEVKLAPVSEESTSCCGSSYELATQPPPQQSESEAGHGNKSRNEDEMTEEEMFEHLHQVFITKNTVLCREVEKNFKELCRACPSTRRRVQFEDKEIPARIQDVEDEAWPLFVGSRDWLLLLDASLPGKPFFRRAADGHLVRKIDGWGRDENHLRFIPLTESDEEDSDEESEDRTESQSGDEEHNDGLVQNNNGRDPRTEITYEVFKDAIWPKMRKSLKEKVDYHPTLVWTEIRSFIKGSAEALLGENGILNLDEYKSLGKKKAPNFTADREIVYRLFEVYQRVRSSNRMFDEADLVYSLHQRLQGAYAPDWSVHEFYVDETQDFTQAELSLLIRCCRFPNRLFFTGDTAQSIMKGIAFRFHDLKSLFYQATSRVEEQQALVTVPKTLYQLTHNYRSHAGILRLASSIVDLLVRFFPESFDKLEKDQGLFEGPKPVLLESCSLTDLAMILRGNRRHSSRIEFGAHQVVLVVSNEAREAMPDELKQGLVMTIYEAKGLEFDDVLIYNFFKDSQASKEWRVVTTFAEELQNGSKSVPVGLVELSEENVRSKPTRPLEFDSEKHKVLNSEFKNLYTAVTRARVNVWFFDEDVDARTPIFEYFRRLDLVKLVALESGNNADSISLASMFAVQSTPDEWRRGGMRFYNNRLWAAAIQCFTFAGDELMLQRSRAQQQAAEALRVTNRQQMLDEFLSAAEGFLRCDMYYEAGICLHNAREWILLARLYKKTGKVKKAARLFKRKQLFVEASQCYESQNNYAEAIETLCHAGQFEKALGTLERFNSLSVSGCLEERHGIILPKATRTVERLLFQLADQYFQNGNLQQMEEVIQRLPSAADRITFLKKRGCIVEAAKAMSDIGRRDEAARLLRETGRFKEAVKYSSDARFAADCLLFSARTTTDGNDIPKILEQALERYQQCGNFNGQAETLLLLGKISQDVKKVKHAGKLFDKSKNCCGEVESVSELLDLTSSTPPADLEQWIIVRALERVLRLTASLFKPAGKRKVADKIEIEKCEEHFGLCKTDDAQQLMYFAKCGGRFVQVDPELIRKESPEGKIIVATVETHEKIRRFLVTFAARLIAKIKIMLEQSLTRNLVCNNVTQDTLCDNQDCTHPHQDSEQLFYGRFEALFNFVYLESVVEWFIDETFVKKDGKEALKILRFDDFREFRACQRFYHFLCPGSGFRDNQLAKKGTPLLRKIRTYKSISNRLEKFAKASWKNVDEELRRANTDNFLKVSFCLQLIGSGSRMATWICEEEKEFEKKAKRSQTKVTKSQLAKNGMVDNDRRDGKNHYESYLYWWEEGKRRIYVHGDVENAAHLIVRRFLTLTAKRGSMAYPSIANTVMILEHQLTACLALYSRLCSEHRYPICLPGSYLAMVRYWDNLYMWRENRKYTLYRAVEHNVSQMQRRGKKLELQRSVQSILSHIVKLTCGDIAPLFDVLRDALGSDESPKYCSSGEAERGLILVLTMLCNCAKAICHNCDEVLLRNIWRINPHSCLPARMSNVLEDVNSARGFRDVVMTLTRFLGDRGEKLYDLQWNDGRLWYDGPCSSSSFPDKFNVDVSLLREKLKKNQSKNCDGGNNATVKSQGEDLESADGTDVSTETMAGEYMEDEFKEKAKLEMNVTVIQRWLRRMIFVRKRERRLKKEESREGHSKNSKLEDEEKRFTQFGLDTSACGICGTKFEESVPFDTKGSLNESKEGIEEEYSQRKDNLERSFSLDEKSNTFEAHERSLSHLQKEGEFNRYKDYFLTKIHPRFKQEQTLRARLKEPSLNGQTTAESKDSGLTLDLERLERNRASVTAEVQTIESSREWSNTSELERAVGEYQTVLQDFQKIVEEDRNIVNVSEEEEEADEMEANEDGDDASPQIKDILQAEKKRGKRRRHRQRHRKH